MIMRPMSSLLPQQMTGMVGKSDIFVKRRCDRIRDQNNNSTNDKSGNNDR